MEAATAGQRMSADKPRLVFVGAFKPVLSDGTVGGQAIACLGLLDSRKAAGIHWHLIDTTQKSQPPPGFAARAYNAVGRIVRFLGTLLFQRCDGVLIFSAFEPLSLAEKGLMLHLSRLCRVKSTFCLRSEIYSLAKQGRFLRLLARVTVPYASQIVVQTDSAAAALRGQLRIRHDKIAVVANWVDTRQVTTREKAIKDDRAFVFMGWLEKFKGVFELIDAARLLVDRGLRFHLTICGGGTLERDLRERVTTFGLEGRVHIVGWVSGDDKWRLLADSEVLVLPSKSEGMPNFLLEGMAAGLAVVATRLPGAEAIVGNADVGTLVPLDDADALADAMEEMIRDGERVIALGGRARYLISEGHDLDTQAEKLIDLAISGASSGTVGAS